VPCAGVTAELAGTGPGQPWAPLRETPCSPRCQHLMRTPKTRDESVQIEITPQGFVLLRHEQ